MRQKNKINVNMRISKKIMRIWILFEQHFKKWILFYMTNIRHIFSRYNKVLNKKNGCSVPRNFPIKHHKQNNRMINEKKVSRRTYYDEFDNTVNDDIEWDDVALVVAVTTKNMCSAF